MTRRRWIADEVSGGRAALRGSHAAHLARVLRAKVGQEFDIVAAGILRRGIIAKVTDELVEFELGEEIPFAGTWPVTVLISIFKFDRMEWAIEKCAELGVSRIVPIIARRTESHLASTAAKRVERWQRITKQAAEQSRRTSVPEIAEPTKVREAVNVPSATRILLDETEADVRLKDVFRGRESGETALAFGPEGGWTEDELKLFHNAGWKSASLGRTILRAETAVIATVAIANSILQ
jgi:16S rRNA (uracil1498-N3)-methyltransferase